MTRPIDPDLARRLLKVIIEDSWRRNEAAYRYLTESERREPRPRPEPGPAAHEE